MFLRLRNMITGRNFHWNRAYWPYIEELMEKIDELPATTAPTLEALSKASYNLVDRALMPADGRKRIFTVNLKHITPEQFKAIHNFITWTYVAMFARHNPSLQDSSLSACVQLMSIHENDRLMIEYILELQDIEAGFASICSKTYYEISRILGCESEEPLDGLLFFAPFGMFYAFALEDLKEAERKF